MQNFQKSIKNATKLQKCDFANYVLRIFRHFQGIFENFAKNMKKSNFSSHVLKAVGFITVRRRPFVCSEHYT